MKKQVFLKEVKRPSSQASGNFINLNTKKYPPIKDERNEKNEKHEKHNSSNYVSNYVMSNMLTGIAGASANTKSSFINDIKLETKKTKYSFNKVNSPPSNSTSASATIKVEEFKDEKQEKR